VRWWRYRGKGSENLLRERVEDEVGVPFYRPKAGGGQSRGRWPAVAMGIKGSSYCASFEEGNRGDSVA
jgi:hypothetical protein